MVKIICIVGLPGSGKTWLARDLSYSDEYTKIFDDIREGEFDRILTAAKIYELIIITDVNFCDSKIRVKAEEKLKSLGRVEWIFFENNIDKCRKNIEYRDDGRLVEGTLDRFGKIYVVPPNVTPLEIWQPNNKT